MKFLIKLIIQLFENKRAFVKNFFYTKVQRKWVRRYVSKFPKLALVLTLRRNAILSAYGLDNKVDSYFGSLLIDGSHDAMLRQKNGKLYIDYAQSDMELKSYLIENNLKESDLYYLIEEFYHKDLKYYIFFCDKDEVLQF
jgi:hypothetical protein